MTSTLVKLDGTHNLRDIGGYTTASGTPVARGRVFRSDNLNSLSDDDLAVLDRLAISSVFDFRGDREVELQPSRLWSAVSRHVRVPIVDSNVPASSATVQEKGFIEQVESGELVEVTEEDVATTYIGILDDHGPKFAPVLDAVAADRGPVLYHCTAGKDRTGLATALIHGLCGVSRDDIIADFVLSNEYRLGPRLAVLGPRFEALGIDIEPLIPALAAPESAMTAALDHLEHAHGGIGSYVTESVGVNDGTIASLVAALVN